MGRGCHAAVARRFALALRLGAENGSVLPDFGDGIGRTF